MSLQRSALGLLTSRRKSDGVGDRYVCVLLRARTLCKLYLFTYSLRIYLPRCCTIGLTSPNVMSLARTYASFSSYFLYFGDGRGALDKTGYARLPGHHCRDPQKRLQGQWQNRTHTLSSRRGAGPASVIRHYARSDWTPHILGASSSNTFPPAVRLFLVMNISIRST